MKNRTLGRSLSKKIREIDNKITKFSTSPITSFGSWTRLYEPAELVLDPGGNFIQLDNFNVDASLFFRVGTKVRAVLGPSDFRYFYIVDVDNNVADVVGEPGESIIPANIDYFEYSDLQKPIGFPDSFSSDDLLVDNSFSALSDGERSTTWKLEGSLCTIDFHYNNYTLSSSSDHLYTASPIPFTSDLDVDQLFPCICINDGKQQSGLAKLLRTPASGDFDIEFTPLSETPASGLDTWDANTEATSLSVSFSYFISSF